MGPPIKKYFLRTTKHSIGNRLVMFFCLGMDLLSLPNFHHSTPKCNCFVLIRHFVLLPDMQNKNVLRSRVQSYLKEFAWLVALQFYPPVII